MYYIIGWNGNYEIIFIQRKLTKTRSRYTYGVAVDKMWQKDDGEERKKLTAEGAITESAFSILLVRDEEYDEGEMKEFEYWIPAECKKLEVFLYASEDEFAKYVKVPDGSKCMKGTFEILPITIDIHNPSKEKRKFEMRLVYSANGLTIDYKDPDSEDWIKTHVDTTALKRNDDE